VVTQKADREFSGEKGGTRERVNNKAIGGEGSDVYEWVRVGLGISVRLRLRLRLGLGVRG